MMPFWWGGDRLADRHEQFQPLAWGQVTVVAVFGDRHAVDQLHHEVGPAGVGGAGIEDFGDIGMVHQGQGLAFGLEAGDDLFGIHAQLDDFERDTASNRFLLLRHIDHAAAAFADWL